MIYGVSDPAVVEFGEVVCAPLYVVREDMISWPTRGPNVDQTIGSTMRSVVAAGVKNACKRARSEALVVRRRCPRLGLSRRRSRVRVPSLPSLFKPFLTCRRPERLHGPSFWSGLVRSQSRTSPPSAAARCSPTCSRHLAVSNSWTYRSMVVEGRAPICRCTPTGSRPLWARCDPYVCRRSWNVSFATLVGVEAAPLRGVVEPAGRDVAVVHRAARWWS